MPIRIIIDEDRISLKLTFELKKDNDLELYKIIRESSD